MKRTGMKIAGGLVLSGILIAALVLPQVVDVPPIDDSDLTPKAEQKLSDNQNAFLVYQQAAASLQLTQAEGDKLKKMFSAKATWNPAFTKTLVAQNSHALDLFMQADRMPGFQLPMYYHHQTAGEFLNEKIIHFEPLMRLADLNLAYARQLHQDGHDREALKRLFAVFNFAKKIHRNTLISAAVGIGMQARTLNILGDMIPSMALSSKEIQSYLAEFDHFSEMQDTFADVFRKEYQFGTSVTLYAAHNWTGGGKLPSADLPPDLAEYIRHTAVFWYTYHPNRIKKEYAACFRPIIQAIYSRDKVMMLNRENDRCARKTSHWTYFLPNGLGNVFMDVAMPRFGDAVTQNIYLRHAQWEVMRTALALKAYQADHQAQLPPDLKTLTPDYLKAIPQDPMDDKPIRYSSAHRLVYSVGTIGEFADLDKVDLQNSKRPAMRL